MVALRAWRADAAPAGAVLHELGPQAWQIVSQNPYALAEVIRGFGFKTASHRPRLGIAADRLFDCRQRWPHRQRGVERRPHLDRSRAACSGHRELTGVALEQVAAQLDELGASGRLAWEQDAPAGELCYALPDVQARRSAHRDRQTWLLAQPPARGLA